MIHFNITNCVFGVGFIFHVTILYGNTVGIAFMVINQSSRPIIKIAYVRQDTVFVLSR